MSNNKSKFIYRGEIDISELGFSKSSATKMPGGTVLFSFKAPIGYIAIAANDSNIIILLNEDYGLSNNTNTNAISNDIKLGI